MNERIGPASATTLLPVTSPRSLLAPTLNSTDIESQQQQRQQQRLTRRSPLNSDRVCHGIVGALVITVTIAMLITPGAVMLSTGLSSNPNIQNKPTWVGAGRCLLAISAIPASFAAYHIWEACKK